MQTKKVARPKNLVQGSIFSVDKLILRKSDAQGNNSSTNLHEFYPEISSLRSKGTHCIILSQTCDLVLEEMRKPDLTHIVFSILEPLDKYISDGLNRLDLKKFQFKYSYLGQEIIFEACEKRDEKIVTEIGRIVDNNHKWLYFIELPGEKIPYWVVNLNKIASLKVEHYNAILKQTKFELKPSFAEKLGWKLANLFGRVGTMDYSANGKKRIAEFVYEQILGQNTQLSVPLSNEQFEEAKKLKNLKDPKKIEDLINTLRRKVSETE